MDVWESRKTLHCLTGRIHQYIEEKLGERSLVAQNIQLHQELINLLLNLWIFF